MVRVSRAETYDALGDCLTDGVDLGCVSTALYADSDVDIGCIHIFISNPPSAASSAPVSVVYAPSISITFSC